MTKKHDENKDLRCFSRIGKVDYSNRTLRVPKSTNLGIRILGRIDYLTHYCGWHFIWDNSATPTSNQNNDTNENNVRAQKKAKKEPKLTDKTKKNNKKK